MSVLTDLRSQRDQIITELDALMNQPEFDPEDKVLVENRGKVEALDNRIQSIVDWESRKAASAKIDSLALRHREEKDEAEKRSLETVPSLGEAWTRSKAYEEYKQLPRGTSGRVQMPFDAIETQRRAPILTSTFANLIEPDRIGPTATPQRQTPLLDLISRVQVSSGSVEWIHYAGAAPLGTVTPEGQPKTEATVAPVLKTVTLETIASWAQYSRQFGEDAPALVNFLNSALARGILDKREALAAAALTGDASIPTVPNVGGDLMSGIRLAIGQVQNAGFTPQAIVINPADYAALDVGLLGATFNGPVINGSYWGVRVVPAGAVASGTAFVGDFSVGMVELVRRDIAVFTTDSHDATFLANVLTTLVEARAKAIVQRPEALAKVSGTVLGTASGGGGGAATHQSRRSSPQE